MSILRRLVLTMPVLTAPRIVRAQSRSVRIIVPFAAGGAADSATRSIAPRLGERLGVTLIVENRTGAGGSVGGGEVARSIPDGTTLLMDASSHIVNPSLLRGLPFDYATAFTPISMVVTFPQVLAVKADLPARNLAEFVALARRQPLNIGTQGNATAGHLGLAQLNQTIQTDMTHVAYRGGADAARDLAAGTLDGCFITMLSAGPVVDSGRARFIAVSTAARVPIRPNVPTFAEAGVSGIEISEWAALFAPAATPPAQIAAIHAALAATLAEAPIQTRLAQLAAGPVGNTPEEFGRFVTAGRLSMAELVRVANIRIE